MSLIPRSMNPPILINALFIYSQNTGRYRSQGQGPELGRFLGLLSTKTMRWSYPQPRELEFRPFKGK